MFECLTDTTACCLSTDSSLVLVLVLSTIRSSALVHVSYHSMISPQPLLLQSAADWLHVVTGVRRMYPRKHVWNVISMHAAVLLVMWTLSHPSGISELVFSYFRWFFCSHRGCYAVTTMHAAVLLVMWTPSHPSGISELFCSYFRWFFVLIEAVTMMSISFIWLVKNLNGFT